MKLVKRWCIVCALLLAAALAAPRLAADAFTWDEVASMIVAGGGQYGPFTPQEAWAAVADRSPDQALGLALVLSQWGKLFGWTEFSVRLLAFFAGILSIAMIYRVGRDMLGLRAGVAAAWMLAPSLYYSNYLHQARIFTLVVVAVLLTVWSYWRLAVDSRGAGFWPFAGLTVGGVMLFYTHYFATPLLIVIALYHLLFVPKNRRWWLPALPAIIAGLAFLPALGVFVSGVNRNLSMEALRAQAMSPPEIVGWLAYYLGNGSVWVLILLLVAGVFTVWVWHTGARPSRAVGLLLWLAGVYFAVILLANAWLQVMVDGRVRYLMGLWPLLTLLLGWLMAALWNFRRWVGQAVLILWVGFATFNTLTLDRRFQLDDTQPMPWREMQAAVIEHGAPEADVLVFKAVFSRMREHYSHGLTVQRQIVETWHDRDDMGGFIAGTLRVWVVEDLHHTNATGDEEVAFALFDAALADNYALCQTYIADNTLTLALYVREAVFCPQGEPLYTFANGAALTGFEADAAAAETIIIRMNWAMPNPTEPYSIALHVVDRNGAIIAQGDRGLTNGPAQVQIDGITPGEYDLRVGLYTWRDGTPVAIEGVDASVVVVTMVSVTE